MQLLIISIWGLLSFGTYEIICEIKNLPKIKFSGKLKNLFLNKKNEKEYINNNAYKIVNYIKVPKKKKRMIEDKLKSLNMQYSAELYYANNLIKCLPYLIAFMIFMFINRIIAIIFIFIGIYLFFSLEQEINKRIEEKIISIENEIPSFLSFITQSFMYNNDIKMAFKTYEKRAGSFLKNDLNIAIAEMETGSYEIALKRLDVRINSVEFSKLIRAISSVLRGDDNILYLRTLQKEFETRQLEMLRRECDKKPSKIKIYSILLMILIIVMFLYVFGMNIFVEIKSFDF